MFSVIFLLCLLHYTSGFFVPCPQQRLTKLYETPNSPASSSSSITKVDALEATETKTIAGEDEEGLRDEEEEEAGIVKGFKRVFNALQEGDSLKQAVADGIAITGGDYNYEEELEKALEISKSKPIVMFIWNNSPACKKAIKYLRIAGVNQKKVRYVELDDDWTEGNRLRAVLGMSTYIHTYIRTYVHT